MGDRVQMVGKTFGRLLILSKLPYKINNQFVFSARCSCGTIRAVVGHNVRSGKTKSCGCFRREYRALPPEKADKNYILSVYRSGARARNLCWDLSVEEFERLITGDCHYCGVPPSNLRARRKTQFRYNGIDRLENSVGYTKENSVTCCVECNMAKKQRSANDFISHCRRVAENFSKV